MEKNVMIGIFYEYYGKLLSKKQQEAIELYYEEDLSLSEIANIKKVSKQNISETIKRSEKILINFEEKIGLYKKSIELQGLIDRLDEKLIKDISEEKYSEYIDIIFQINSKLK